MDSNGTPLYYQHDQLGSTRLLTDGSGNTAATYSYDPYGNLTLHTGASDTPLRWNSQYQDTATGLYYLRARYYDPATAQFLTRDPLSSVTQDPYGYSAESPLAFTDALGLAPNCPPNIGNTSPARLLSSSWPSQPGEGVLEPGLGGEVGISDSWLAKGGIAALLGVAAAKCKEAGYCQFNDRGYELHHIVAKWSTNPFNLVSKGILSSVDVGIDSQPNLVSLPYRIHRRIHTNLYYATVARLLRNAVAQPGDARANVIAALTQIKLEMELYIFPE